MATKFRPHDFKPGNKLGIGRPVGSRSKATLALEAMGEEKAESLFERTIIQALSGDMVAMRLVLERIYPVQKPRTYLHSDAKPVKTLEDVDNFMSDIIDKVGKGIVSLEEGEKMTAILAAKSKSIMDCMEHKLVQIEAEVEKMKEVNNA